MFLSPPPPPILQDRTLPPVPSHRSSFRGHEVTLEVQMPGVPGTPRFKREAFTNEYVGSVRIRLARHFGVDAQNLRLLCSGAERGKGA